MAPERKADQKVEAFSLSKDLLKLAVARARELQMTKSGYFRYCLALELGMSKDQARFLALHNSLQRELAGESFSHSDKNLGRPANLVQIDYAKSAEEDQPLAAQFNEDPGAVNNPAVNAKAVNLAEDPNLDPAVKAQAEQIEREALAEAGGDWQKAGKLMILRTAQMMRKRSESKRGGKPRE